MIAAAQSTLLHAVSPDGRFAALSPFDAPAPVIDAIVLPSGERAFSLPSTNEMQPNTMTFAADGRHAAVLWVSNASPTRAALDLRDLPTGRRLRTVDLPAARWWSLVGWQGDRVVVTVHGPEHDSDRSHAYRVDLTAPSPTLDPWPAVVPTLPPPPGEEDTTWEVMQNCVLRTRPVPPPRTLVTAWADRVAGWFGRDPEPPADAECRGTVFDPHGRAVGDFVSRRGGVVAPAGDSIIFRRGMRTVKLWNFPQQSPWPRAVITGLAAAGGWAWLERRRARR